jgi:tetratricopeptide (TPR) repeat protein
VVIDEETKQPVEGAWVSATLEVKTRTIQGDVYNVLSVDSPHTRTDSKGKFVIPPKKFKKPLPPVGFGAEIQNFSVNATTIDDKTGGFYLKDYEGKKKIEVTIYVRPWEKGLKDEREYFSYIQSLYNYCLSGRFGVEVPPVEGGCDEWELNYAILKHERYLKIFPKTEEIRSHYSLILEQLGLLYERNGELKKAIEYLKRAKEIRFFRPQDLDYEIKRILQKLEGVNK